MYWRRRRNVLKRGAGRGALIFYSDFPKCTLRCSLTQANVFAIFTESSLSVVSFSGGPASWCFLGSSWVVWRQKMCALKSSMSQVLSNTSWKVFFGTSLSPNFGLGGLQAPCPPCSASYYFLCPTNSGKKAWRHLERNTGTTGLQIEVLLLTMF